MYPSLGTPVLHAFQLAYNFNSAVTFFILCNTLDVPLPVNSGVTVPCLLTQGGEVSCVLCSPRPKLYGNCLYWMNILYWNFFHLALEKSLPWNCPLYWIYFLPFRIFEQFALALKHRVCPENFHCIEYSFTFRIFEQLAFALKNKVCPEFTVLNIYFLSFRIFEQLALALKNRVALKFFIIKDFWATCACPENRVFLNPLYWMYIFYHSRFLSNFHLPWKTRLALIFFTVLKYFYHSGFLSILRLHWKQSLPWKFSGQGDGRPPAPHLVRLWLWWSWNAVDCLVLQRRLGSFGLLIARIWCMYYSQGSLSLFWILSADVPK